MEEYRFTAEKCNFQGENGYMVSQFYDGKKVASCFVAEEVYEEYCKEVGMSPEII